METSVKESGFVGTESMETSSFLATEPSALLGQWLQAFEKAVASADDDGLKSLFLEESYWRDQIGLTWDMVQYWGRDALIPPLASACRAMSACNFRIAAERTAPAMLEYEGKECVEGFCEFDMPHGIGQAMVRLVPDTTSPAGCKAFTISTDLESVAGVEERFSHTVTPEDVYPKFPIHGYAPAYRGQTWSRYLRDSAAFEDQDPEVLVVGGGHTGLMVAARLHVMGFPYLIVDRNARPGDSWRVRYDNLALHTVGATNQMPYVRTPEIFPDYMPKERWADWLESYQKAMGLNYWSSTTLTKAVFDETDGRWTCTLEKEGGEVRTLRPRHVVLALGNVGNDPIIPDLPGLSDFAGSTVHSKFFQSGADFAGKRVLVVGTSTSAHDIALDLSNNDCQVTMAQRGPTIITKLVEGVRHNVNYIANTMSLAEADQRRGANNIYPLRQKFLQRVTEQANRDNAEMNAALERAGLRLWSGPDDTGWLGKLARDFKGFYHDMGCIDPILDGRIKIIQMDDFDRFVAEGARMNDGTVLPFDTIVFATGFHNQIRALTEIFGSDVVERVGPSIAFDEMGEQLGNARPLHHRQIWQIYGGINDCRRLSKILALQLVAELKGFVPPLERQPDNSLRRCE